MPRPSLFSQKINIKNAIGTKNEKRHAIIVLKSTNAFSNTEIAGFVNCSAALVTKTCKDYVLRGTYMVKHIPGRKISRAHKKAEQSLNDNIGSLRNKTKTEICLFVNDINKRYKISKRTFERILKRNGYKSYMCRKVPFLTPNHKKARVVWAKNHLKRKTNFKNWIFTDECCVKILSLPRMRYLCKRSEIQQDEHFINRQQVYEKYGISVKFWASASAKGKCCLRVIHDKPFDSLIYSKLIADVKPCFVRHNHNFIFQQDNASIHNSEHTLNELDKINITPVEWPAKSPDLSPIENVFALMKPYIRRQKPKNKPSLEQAILYAWDRIPNKTIQACFHDYSNRLRKVIQLDGNTI